MDDTRPSAELLLSTRTGLHAVAEAVLAGPQHRASGTIRLSVAPGAIETVARPRLRLTASSLSGPGGEASLLGATTALALGAAVGVQAGPPDGVYRDTSGVAVDQTLSIDADTATALMDWFAVGAAGLLTFAPDERAVLWPEHFDLAITLDEVNYGVSPGDAFSPLPYAYVGPHERVDDAFFDAPFGAVRTWEQAPDAARLAAFFAEGRDRVRAVRAGT
jgi:hypothetical protein